MDGPIIFSAPMVLALLREAEKPGTGKRMTRRLAWRDIVVGAHGDEGGIHPVRERIASSWQGVKPGDRLYVRENFWAYGKWVEVEKKNGDRRLHFQRMHLIGTPSMFYAAENATAYEPAGTYGSDVPGWHLRPCIFLPRNESRLTLIVTASKTERLQEISEEEASSEGIDWRFSRDPMASGPAACRYGNDAALPNRGFSHASGAFAELWRSLHGPESWDANPEVVALTFTVHKTNIDAMERAA